MSWEKDKKTREKRGYHHGNLREALINAALQLIGQKGPEGVTLAEAARMAGVSPAAPYRHFADRSNLMAAVSAVGFTRFADMLEKAWAKGAGTPLEALQRTGKAYLHFARTEPALYTAMFEAGVSHTSEPELSREAERAFDVLKNACAKLHDTLPGNKRAPALMMALHIWAMAHGIAALFGRGDAGSRAIPVSAEELLEAGVLVYLDGLGLRG